MNKLFLKYIVIILLLFSCSNNRDKTIDTELNNDDKNAKYTLIKNNKKKEGQKFYNIPKTTKIITTPPPPKIGGEKRISFAVTDQIPLKDVLIEIGRVAKIDVDIDPAINGGIIINAVNRPLKEVIDRIANSGNLRYSFDNGVLSFVRDTPFLKNYYVDYLIEGNLWSDVESNISAIIQSSNKRSNSTENNQNEVIANNSSFSSNRSAGLIAVFATLKQHEIISDYLRAVEKSASAQVLIEAKIVEVELIDEFEAGINWSYASTNPENSLNTDAIKLAGSVLENRNSFNVSSIFGSDINATISALERFGKAKTLSSPRIMAMNNQLSLLNFSEKLIYFEIESSNVTSTNQNPNVVESINSEVKEKDVGIKLEITPSINLRTKEIVMKIKPTMAINSGLSKTDPASDESNPNKIPIIKSRELQTVAKVQSGNVIVIGGLMQQKESDNNVGIPYISKIPILGNVFKFKSNQLVTVETVIFIKATIVESGSSINTNDRKFEQLINNTRSNFSNQL